MNLPILAEEVWQLKPHLKPWSRFHNPPVA
jgi:hypothetical protein